MLKDDNERKYTYDRVTITHPSTETNTVGTKFRVVETHKNKTVEHCVFRASKKSFDTFASDSHTYLAPNFHRLTGICQL